MALVPANTLPKTPLGGIHLSETKQLFLEGSLHPCNVLMCPHTCVTNLPKPRQKQPGMSKSQACLRSLRWAWSQWSCLLQVSPPGGVAALPQQFLRRHLCGRRSAAHASRVCIGSALPFPSGFRNGCPSPTSFSSCIYSFSQSLVYMTAVVKCRLVLIWAP